MHFQRILLSITTPHGFVTTEMAIFAYNTKPLGHDVQANVWLGN